MIYTAKQLEGYRISARDGVLGTVKDIFFDDEVWTARYFVVSTGSWLKGRPVLLAAARLLADKTIQGTLAIDATQDQVRNSPSVDEHPTVSRQQEQALHDHFGWPYYWGVAPFAGGVVAPVTTAGIVPGGMPDRIGTTPEGTGTARRPDRPDAARAEGDPHLRSVREVRGYAIAARDGDIGHVEDFLLEDVTWEIRHLIVDTRNWLPGRKVLVTPASIQSVDWSTSDVRVNLTRDQIKTAPEYDPSQPVSADYTDRLEAHYRALR